VLCGATTVAHAERITVQPKLVRPGDAVLVVVSGAAETPEGRAGDKPLHFFRARNGYQALFAVPLDETARAIAVHVDGTRQRVVVRDIDFPESDVIVEDEYANPPAAERKQIDEDNRAILDAMKSDGGPQFTHAFRRPRGEVTSTFGEWRTFNDGHTSQHLGTDYAAREGAKVRSINDGTVTLVRDTFLAGNVVVIAHGNGIATAYFHLSDSVVAEGDVVRAGAVIGRAGHTGRATGPHLHLAVHVPTGFVDPATFFRLPISPATPMSARRAIRRTR
jgi:murein DD-endopeptidase MepM/ murein hydrolase activator NlpD